MRRGPLPLAAACYVITPMALIDLAAMLPFYLPLVTPLDQRFLRPLRLLRLLRLLKAQRYPRSLQLIGKGLATVLVAAALIFVAAAVVYHLEDTVQPDKFPEMFATLRWAIDTLTTIG